jgi:hypothetical protein
MRSWIAWLESRCKSRIWARGDLSGADVAAADRPRPRCRNDASANLPSPKPLPSYAAERLSDASYRHAELSLHQLGIEPEHVIAQAPEHRIAPSVSLAPAAMIQAIHLDDQTPGGRQEIRDVAAAHGNLPFEVGAQAAAAQRGPQEALGFRRRETHLASVQCDLLRVSGAGTAGLHGDLLGPAARPGAAPNAQVA